jgi:hypothetical protein
MSGRKGKKKAAAPLDSDALGQAPARAAWGPVIEPPHHLFGKAPPVPERVAYIADLMASGQWSTKRARELAVEWGIDLVTVQVSSAEAGRLLAMARGTIDEFREKLYGHLEEALAFARAEPIPGQAAKAIVAVVETYAKVSGALAPLKVAPTDTAGNDLPVFLRGAADHPELARFAVLHGRTPTENERALLLEGKPADEVTGR